MTSLVLGYSGCRYTLLESQTGLVFGARNSFKQPCGARKSAARVKGTTGMCTDAFSSRHLLLAHTMYEPSEISGLSGGLLIERS